uniref:Uncharacterized protein n=1 Tax=Xenopus tropicalis TaxID=8364 RepID=A0A6I8PSC0_XENTR
MANNVNWIQRSSVPSFAQMLKKNLPAQAPAVNLSSTVSTCCPYVEPDCGTAKVTQITGFPPITLPEPFLSEMIVPASLSSLPPRKVTKEFVVKYRHGDLNPVSALYQFAQMQRMEIDLKSTVTTGNVFGAYFAFCAVIDGIEYKPGMRQKKAQGIKVCIVEMELAREDLSKISSAFVGI